MKIIVSCSPSEQLDSLVGLQSFDLQDDSFLVQPRCSVLQRLWLPLLAGLTVSFAVQFYRSAGIPAHRKQHKVKSCIHQEEEERLLLPHPHKV